MTTIITDLPHAWAMGGCGYYVVGVLHIMEDWAFASKTAIFEVKNVLPSTSQHLLEKRVEGGSNG